LGVCEEFKENEETKKCEKYPKFKEKNEIHTSPMYKPPPTAKVLWPLLTDNPIFIKSSNF
jgi:hypothetical protein